MKTLDLGRAAAAAEVLLLKRMVGRQVTRAVFGAVAAVFVVGALILLHVVIYQAMAPYLSPLARSAILFGIDLVIAIVCGLMAMKESVAMTALLGPIGSLAGRVVGRKRATGLTLAALAATFLAGNRK